MGKGNLIVKLRVGDDFYPVTDTKVLVRDSDGGVREFKTDVAGNTPPIAIDAPDYQNSLKPSGTSQVYSVCDVEVPYAKGYMKKTVHGVHVFDTKTSILEIHLSPYIEGESDEFNTEDIYIPGKHGININESQLGNEASTYDIMSNISTQEIPLANEVSIPTYITVHLGTPSAAANNVRIPFKDYIKNVASSEIYPTWPDAAIRANIYAQISFALNRFYTVWYRSRGYEFDITNSTAFDQYFVYGREIFSNISDIVDGIFNLFIRRPGRREPFFASYCNGTTSTCAGMSQWGTVPPANDGYSPLQILRSFYPSDIQIVQSNNFTEQIGTFGGVVLRETSSGDEVRTMQLYLNRIAGNFPSIPLISTPNGYFGSSTTAAVKEFQRINNLIADGLIGKKTWYSISYIFAAVKRLAELDSEGERISIGAKPPTEVVQIGSRGEYVVELQFLLNLISEFFPLIPFVIESSIFTEDTKRAVVEFQHKFGLKPDGIVGSVTWNKLYTVYKSIKNTIKPGLPPFPGTLMGLGSRGSYVKHIQQFLNAISAYYPSIPLVTADGIFGTNTDAAVRAFQKQFGLTVDGIVGQQTWNGIVSAYSRLGSAPEPTPVVPPQFPGTALKIDSRGSNVMLMQQYLNSISKAYPSIPSIVADGVFGLKTDAAVRAFQKQFGLTVDGIIGKITWDKIIAVYSDLGNVYGTSIPAVSDTDYSALTLLLAMRMLSGRMYR